MSDRKQLCSDTELNTVMSALSSLPSDTNDLDRLLRTYPTDPRLLFVKGSMLAAGRDYAAATAALRRAVDLAPEYAIARFQLGLLLLTSGKPCEAQEAWGPLHNLAANTYLRRFVDGLCHLIRGEFDSCIRVLREGISANTENAPLNIDMQMVIDEVRAQQSGSDQVSAVGMLLQQAAFKRTTH